MTIVYVLLAVAAYPCLLLALGIAAQPMRRKLFEATEELLADRRTTKEQREQLNHMLDTAFAFRVGCILPVAVISTIADDILGRIGPDCKDTWLERDPRHHSVVIRYLASISAANPIGLLVALPFMLLALVIAALKGAAITRKTLEVPLLRASEGTHIPMAMAA